MDGAKLSDAEFSAAGESEWRDVTQRGLKDSTVEDLSTRAEDGFFYRPLYERSKDTNALAHAHDGPWTIFQPIDDPNPSRANRQLLADLEGGAGGVALVFEGAAAARGFGIPLDPKALSATLDGVSLEMIKVRIEPHVQGERAIELVRELAQARGHDLAALSIDLGIDAVGPFAFNGGCGEKDARPDAALCALAARMIDAGFAGRLFEADGRVFHDAGATDGQEIGAVLASALHHLKSLVEGGYSPEDAAKAIGFTLAIDQRQFEQTGKLRALRLVWAKLLEECGLDAPPPARIHAETSSRMMAARDPHTNILRATIAAFAAVTGGADSLAVLPYTSPLGLAGRGARRLARNIQIILQEESHLAVVSDPCAGSGGLEALTDLIAQCAWSEFQKIETEGGIMRSLKSGVLQNRILDAAAARQERLASGAVSLVGQTVYPLECERAHDLLEMAAAWNRTPSDATECEPLRPKRVGEGLDETEDAR